MRRIAVARAAYARRLPTYARPNGMRGSAAAAALPAMASASLAAADADPGDVAAKRLSFGSPGSCVCAATARFVVSSPLAPSGAAASEMAALALGPASDAPTCSSSGAAARLNSKAVQNAAANTARRPGFASTAPATVAAGAACRIVLACHAAIAYVPFPRWTASVVD